MRPALLAAALILAPAVAAAQSWCGAATLNATERTICAIPYLGGLDTELEQIWRSTTRGASERQVQRTWLSNRRNACGADPDCIEAAYYERLDALYAGVDHDTGDAALLRPWCASGSLNTAERTICSDERLANLDAALEAVYGAAQARAQDYGQQQWLRAERDACTTDRGCLGFAYMERIIELGGRLRQ